MHPFALGSRPSVGGHTFYHIYFSNLKGLMVCCTEILDACYLKKHVRSTQKKNSKPFYFCFTEGTMLSLYIML
ncbi:hypothetical protein ACJX0J_013433, partial [Zea mays]